MVIKTVYSFVDSNLGVETSSKKKGGGGFLKLFCLGGGQMTYLGEGRVWLGDKGYGETIKINYKMNFVQNSCQRF